MFERDILVVGQLGIPDKLLVKAERR